MTARHAAFFYLLPMNELTPFQHRIHLIRGRWVMLDFDLAEAYHVETAQLKRQVRRNIERFEGEDFMFEVSSEEILRCQNGTSSWGGHRYGAFAFTELGVAMLSSVLRSKTAIDTNRDIMRAFVDLRHMAATLPATAADVQQLRRDFEQLKLDIEDCLHDQNDINESTRLQLDSISQALAELQAKEPRPKPRRPIGFIQPNED